MTEKYFYTYNHKPPPDTAQGGFGFIPNGIREKNIFFYHPDHLGSSSYITGNDGKVSQHTEYIAFGEILFDEHNTEHTMPYLFNGKELDQETNLTYFGARYLDMKTSLWLNTDPLSGYNPTFEHEHYIDGQHNGGIFNPMNLNTYGYTYQNPIRYIDPNGKQVDAIIKDLGELWDAWNPFGRAYKRMSGISEKEEAQQRLSTTIRSIGNAGKHAATADVGHFILDGVGFIEPTPFTDVANAIWYALEGDNTNAVISGVSIIPYIGDIGKGGKYGGKIITQIQKHHIIPKQLYNIIPGLGDLILKNSGLNLKQVPNKFHGNHPAYTN